MALPLLLFLFVSQAQAQDIQTDLKNGMRAESDFTLRGTISRLLVDKTPVLYGYTAPSGLTSYYFPELNITLLNVREEDPLNVQHGMLFLFRLSRQAIAAGMPHEGLLTPGDERIAYVSDGCTGWPDFWWGHCCAAHDDAYHIGGGISERWAADGQLLTCVTLNGGPGLTMYAGVRYFGCVLFSWTILPRECGYLCLYQCGYY